MYRQNLLPNKSLERDVCSASRCALRSTNAPQLRRWPLEHCRSAAEPRTKMPRTLYVALALLLCSNLVFAQASAPALTASRPPAALRELDTYVKVFVAALTGLGTLLGLPIIFLTYRKTHAASVGRVSAPTHSPKSAPLSDSMLIPQFAGSHPCLT